MSVYSCPSPVKPLRSDNRQLSNQLSFDELVYEMAYVVSQVILTITVLPSMQDVGCHKQNFMQPHTYTL